MASTSAMTVSMTGRVHIRLDLEDEARHLRLGRLHEALVGVLAAGRRREAGEPVDDAVLDGLHLGHDRLHDRPVVVDDEVEHRMEDVVLPVGELPGAGLRLLPHGRVRSRGAVADGDDVASSDEDLGLSERDASLNELGGPHHHEKAVAVSLDLGTLVGVPGILDGEPMQPELGLHLFEELHRGLVEADPDDVIGPARPFPGLVDPDVRDPASAGVDPGGHDARDLSTAGGGRRTLGNEMPDGCRRRSGGARPVQGRRTKAHAAFPS
jgi:hypothetical protein